MIGYSRGDTIIEVLLAITVFSLVSVGGITVMNQGTAIAQRALEIDLVRQQIDTQADSLRFLNREYIDNPTTTGGWSKIIAKSVAQAQGFDSIANESTCNRAAGTSFAIDVDKLEDPNSVLITSVQSASTYAKVSKLTEVSRPTADGIWIEAVKSPDSLAGPTEPGFYDFHIRACWNTPGQSAPITLGTIVRLYAPKN